MLMLVGLLILMLYGYAPADAYSLAMGSYSTQASPVDNRDISVSPSFAIHALIVKCASAQSGVWFVVGMGVDNSKTIADAANAATNRIQSVGTGTFQVGTSTNVQPASETCYYVAFGDDGQGDLAYGTRSGNSTDNFDFTTPGFLPTFFITGCYDTCVAGAPGKWRGSHVGDLSDGIGAEVDAPNHIQAFISTGVTLGNSNAVNATGTTYAWMAIKAVTGYNLSGSHVGNTTDNVTIPAIDTPTFALVKTSGNTAACARFGSSGDLSGGLTASVWTTNIIQAFNATGFERGTAPCVADDTVTLHWFVSKSPVYAAVGGRKQRSVVITGG